MHNGAWFLIEDFTKCVLIQKNLVFCQNSVKFLIFQEKMWDFKKLCECRVIHDSAYNMIPMLLQPLGKLLSSVFLTAPRSLIFTLFHYEQLSASFKSNLFCEFWQFDKTWFSCAFVVDGGWYSVKCWVSPHVSYTPLSGPPGEKLFWPWQLTPVPTVSSFSSKFRYDFQKVIEIWR